MPTQTVYLDESGFTGGNLLDGDQSILVFAAVSIGETDAPQIWSEVVSRSRANSRELKGSNLTGHSAGRAAITWLLENTNRRTKLAVINKRYALAGKFFEYIFEPVLAERSEWLYAMDFHRFVALALYRPFAAGYPYASEILGNFQILVNRGDLAKLADICNPSGYTLDETDPLTHLITFALCHRQRIETALQSIGPTETEPSWALELSSTTVHCLLAGWAEEYEPLSVYCDHSKPIAANREILDAMVGRQDKVHMHFGSHKGRSFVYNLSQPVQLVNSRQFSGVQIADVWASALTHAFRHREDLVCQRWLELAEDSVDTALLPDSKFDDIKEEGPFINWSLLIELSRRSVAGESVTDGLGEFIEYATYAFRNRGQ